MSFAGGGLTRALCPSLFRGPEIANVSYCEVVMNANYILSDYIERAMAQAEYDKLEDGSFAGRIASCKGVAAFGATLKVCEDELRSTLED